MRPKLTKYPPFGMSLETWFFHHDLMRLSVYSVNFRPFD